MKAETYRRSQRVRSCVSKIRYRDIEDAKRAKSHYLRKRPSEPLRCHDCPHCGGWHLTRAV